VGIAGYAEYYRAGQLDLLDVATVVSNVHSLLDGVLALLQFFMETAHHLVVRWRNIENIGH